MTRKSDRALTYPELRETKGIPFSRVHIWRLVKQGKFPRPFKVGENTNAWWESEVDAHLAAKAEARGKLPEAA